MATDAEVFSSADSLIEADARAMLASIRPTQLRDGLGSDRCQNDRMRMDTRAAIWDQLFLLVVGCVALYALVLVVAGLWLGDAIFDDLGFGPEDGAILDDQRPYIRLVCGILGAVIVGWMMTIAAIVAGPLRRREPWAWWAIVSATLVWFILDTGLSLSLGFVGHALFNVAFAIGLAIPLAAIRPQLK